MKHVVTGLGLLVITLCLAGWTEKAAWTPDGKQAVIIGSDGLYLCDATGKLSPRLAEGRFGQPAWFADGQRFAVAQYSEVTHWAEVTPALEPEDLKAIEDAAKMLSKGATRAGLNWTGGVPADSLEAQAGRIPIERLRLIVLYLHDGVDPAAANIIVKWKPEAQGRFDQATIHVVAVKGTALEVGRAIAQSLMPIRDICVNSTQNILAFTSGQFGQKASPRLNLWAVPASGATPAVVIERDAAPYVDWTPDGKQLVYMRAWSPKVSDRPRLGSVVRRGIEEADGRLAVAGTRDELAAAIFLDAGRVHCLHDGRVVFSSVALNLPAAKADAPKHYSLFIADPQQHGSAAPGTAVVSALTPKAAASVPEDALPFEVSPDERSVAIASGTEGRCAVVSLGSDNAVNIPIPSSGNEQTTLPAWRSADELSLIASPAAWGAKDGRPELVIWAKGASKVISQGWPDEALAIPEKE